MTKPAHIADWMPSANDQVVEDNKPQTGLRNTGWTPGDQPAAQHFNWFFKRTADAIAWVFSQFANDGVKRVNTYSGTNVTDLKDTNLVPPAADGDFLVVKNIGIYRYTTATTGLTDDNLNYLAVTGASPAAFWVNVLATYVGKTKGAASLDATTKVPMSQLHHGEANGVADLDGSTKVPLDQLPTGLQSTSSGAVKGLAYLDSTTSKVPINQLPIQTGRSETLVASLTSTSKVPLDQLPTGIQTTAVGSVKGLAYLDSTTSRVPLDQLPTGAQTTAVGSVKGLAYLDSTTSKVPINQLPVQTGRSETLVASLNASNKIPLDQLPTGDLGSSNAVGGVRGLPYLDSTNGKVPMAYLYGGTANGVATLDASTKVPLGQLYAGVANGVATLDASTKVPIGQLPSGVANGVATLGSNSKVPIGQLPTGSAGLLATIESTGFLSNDKMGGFPVKAFGRVRTLGGGSTTLDQDCTNSFAFFQPESGEQALYINVSGLSNPHTDVTGAPTFVMCTNISTNSITSRYRILYDKSDAHSYALRILCYDPFASPSPTGAWVSHLENVSMEFIFIAL